MNNLWSQNLLTLFQCSALYGWLLKKLSSTIYDWPQKLLLVLTNVSVIIELACAPIRERLLELIDPTILIFG